MLRRTLAAVIATAALAASAGSTSPSLASYPASERQAAAAPGAERAVKDAVLLANRGGPLPSSTRPGLADLNKSRVNLGRKCSYSTPHNDDGGTLCPYGDLDGSRTLVVLGDSHGLHWVPALEPYAVKHGYRAFYLVKEQCTASIVRNGDPAEARPRAPWVACQAFRDWTLDVIADLDPDVVIVSTSTPTKGVFTKKGYADTPEGIVGPYRDGFRKLFRRIAKVTDARRVMLRDVPARRVKSDPIPCFRPRDHTLRDCLSPRDVQQSRVMMVTAGVEAARNAGAEIVDPTPLFCWRKLCPVAVGQLLPYRNTSHITTEYARHVSGALARLLRLDR
ncbi:MAG: SGNH hydrolase domain-containing protein [Nocardioides sp.]